MSRLLIASVAENDYAEALSWYAKRNVEAALDFEAEFERALNSISADPERFPLCDNRHRYFLLRRFPFQVIYRQRQDIVEVISVAHTSRKPGFWSQR